MDKTTLCRNVELYSYILGAAFSGNHIFLGQELRGNYEYFETVELRSFIAGVYSITPPLNIRLSSMDLFSIHRRYAYRERSFIVKYISNINFSLYK